MEMNTQDSNRPNLHLASVLVGCGAGIVGTLVFATYKQRHFDSMLKKPRAIAGRAADKVDELSDSALDATDKVADAAHRGVNAADKASKRAIETLRSGLTG